MDQVKHIINDANQAAPFMRVVQAAIARGIDPFSQEVIKAIRTAVPGVDQRELDAAAQWWRLDAGDVVKG